MSKLAESSFAEYIIHALLTSYGRTLRNLNSKPDLWPYNSAQRLLLPWIMFTPILVFNKYAFCFRIRSSTRDRYERTNKQTDRRTDRKRNAAYL